MTALHANKAPEAPALGIPVREKLPPKLRIPDVRHVSFSIPVWTTGVCLHEPVDPTREIGYYESDRTCFP